MAKAAKKKPESKPEAAAEEPVVIAYKGFGQDWICNPTGDKPFQYEIGKTYEHQGDVVRCQSGGFHSCEFPLDVFGYYEPAKSRYAVVKAGGKIDREENGDTKIASAKITIDAELKLPELVCRAVDWIMARIDNTKTESNTGDQSAATNTGYRSAASVEGKASVAIATGFYGRAKASEAGAIVLVNRDDDGNIRHIRASRVGENGIRPDVWCTLNDAGEFVEAEA